MHALERWLIEQKRQNGRGVRVRLAQKVGCQPSWISEIAKNGKVPSLPVARKLSEETGIPIEQFAGDAA